MRKRILMVVLALSVLSFTACEEMQEPEKNDETITQGSDVAEEEEKDGDEKKDEVKEEGDTEKTDDPQEKSLEITVYKMDSEQEKIITETVECSELSGENVWQLLKEAGVVSENSKINSLIRDETAIELDVDEEFGEQLRSYGTAGERELLHCVVNTYLDAYQCKTIKITENGEVLCSSHAEYINDFEKYE